MNIRHKGGGAVKTMCKQRTGRAHYASDQYLFADGIAFVCFYDAEHVLSMIAKFLVHLLRVGEGRGGMAGGG